MLMVGVLLLCQLNVLWAVERVGAKEGVNVDLRQENTGVLRITLTFREWSFRSFARGENAFVLPVMHGLIQPSGMGEPALPVWRDLLRLAPGEQISLVDVKGYHHLVHLKEDFGGACLAPAQPSLPKNGARQQWQYNKARYREDRWLGDTLAQLAPVGILRNSPVYLLTVSPCRYHPVKGLVELWDSVEITLKITGTATKGSASTSAFGILDNAFLYNAVQTPDKKVLPRARRFLILTIPEFRNTLQPFVRWKTRQGYRVEMIFRGDPGVGSTADSIRDYLKELYLSTPEDEEPPSYLMIVGDTPQIPPSANPGRVTDLYYATYDGSDDYLPDLFYGRIPARDTAELRNILDKLLEYEQYTFPDPSFLQKAVLVAGVDGTYASVWGNGHIYYANDNYINPEHGYTPDVYLYPASGSSDQEIIDKIGQGVSFVNYTGHGLSSGWKDPTFTISDLADLNNLHKYPLMITNGCETATFGLDECFGEAIVRAAGKGAVAYIGCSDDSYWDEDYYWAVGVGPIVAHPSYQESSLGMYDRLFHDHQEPLEDWYISASQMIFAGNLAVLKGSPARAKLYWQIYHLFGDPSMIPWLAMPDTMEVFLPATLPAGSSYLTVVTDPEAYVGVTCGDSLLGAAAADSEGRANIPLVPFSSCEGLTVTVTRQNRIPVNREVAVVADTLPYIHLDTLMFLDSAGSPLDMLPQGGYVRVNAVITNLGTLPADSLRVSLTSPSPWITVADTLIQLGVLQGSEKDTLTDLFSLRVSDSLPDQARAILHLCFEGADQMRWDHWVPVRLSAALAGFGSLNIDDRWTGNGNYRLDPGEKINMLLRLVNNGHAPLQAGSITFRMTDSLVTIPEQTVLYPTILPGETTTVAVPVTLRDTIPLDSRLGIFVSMQSGKYSVRDTFFLPVSLVYDDFERGDFLSFPWKSAGKDVPWEVTGEVSWDGRYSATSGEIGDGESSSLSLTCNVPNDDSVSFYVKVSSEKDYDILRFYIDGNLQGSWSGEVDWRQVVFPLASGIHELKWSYGKDGNTTKGLDRAWIDFVVLPRGSFSEYDAGVLNCLAPVTGKGLNDHEQVKVLVKNFGKETIDTLPLMVSLNGAVVLQDTMKSPLPSGDTITYLLNGTVDLSVLKQYELQVSTQLPFDGVPRNDACVLHVVHEGTVDLALDTILSPEPDTSFSATESLIVRVYNASSGALDSIPLYCYINGVPSLYEVFDTLLPAGTYAELQFSAPLDLADTGSYVLEVFSSLPADTIHTNDTLEIFLYNKVTWLFRIAERMKVHLYPVPVGDELHLRFEEAGRAEAVWVFDMTGRGTLLRGSMSWNTGEVITLPANRWPPGAYFLTIFTPDRRIVLPFLKK